MNTDIELLLQEIDNLKHELSYYKNSYLSINNALIKTAFDKEDHHEMAIKENNSRTLKKSF